MHPGLKCSIRLKYDLFTNNKISIFCFLFWLCSYRRSLWYVVGVVKYVHFCCASSLSSVFISVLGILVCMFKHKPKASCVRENHIFCLFRATLIDNNNIVMPVFNGYSIERTASDQGHFSAQCL